MKEISHICSSCMSNKKCRLWKQILDIDEDFIKSSFEYDSDIQSVCSAVSYCEDYQPIGNMRAVTVVKLYSSEIQSDVLESLDGLESYSDDEYGNKIYDAKVIKDSILDNTDDDISKTTKMRLESLYNNAKSHNAEKIIVIAQ